MEWDLLEKTTFWVENVDLRGADLGQVAAAAAKALGLDAHEVMVVDVRPGLVAFDVLRRRVQAESVAGREGEILKRLQEVPGVILGPKAGVHSEGVLGLIALKPDEAQEVLSASARMTSEISQAVARRALVFASGSEVLAGKIRDTNSPYLIEALTGAGFRAEFGGILEDDVVAVVNRLEGALERGYGLIITTGGVGAEDKDCNIEAVLRLDPRAHTPWILKFTPDYKRHYKEGVRIAVGRVGMARLIALPGPHEEVRLACRALLEGLSQGLDDAGLAEKIAGVLRRRWYERMGKGGSEHHGFSGHSY
ncbi:molybdopterin-binding protein [Thermosediminibacter oceani]|uniref:Molybdopterin binding domain protein n=1 Tax=Thermosediminibacter oceani (strain ATCC BAA-1034 / DSM 16646 / JW/IW-1228P) TaxID=555079 RepID=D9S0Z2_THEOJ|nr:molybdopterin-binding protein [Thermosediminibacter oceani]ADL07156.1 molybdopterin binding domain protein [Thermosediminibacter oceani DSM 16646]